MNVSPSTEFKNNVTTKIEWGRYTSPTEVITEALHLLEEQDQARATQMFSLNQELGRRLESLDQGRHVSASEARVRLRHKSEQHRQAKA